MTDFLVLGTGDGALALPVQRPEGAEEAPDGMGRRKWTITVANVEQAVVDALAALIGTPSQAESERAIDGTLLTDLPLVPVSGVFATATGITAAEVRNTSTPFRPPIVGSTADFSRRLTLTLREP